MADRLGLAEVIRTLREELYDARVEGAGNVVKFDIESVDLEFKAELAREGGVDGRIRFWILEAGADAAVSSATTQTISLHLKARDAVTGGPVTVADDGSRPQERTSGPRSGPEQA